MRDLGYILGGQAERYLMNSWTVLASPSAGLPNVILCLRARSKLSGQSLLPPRDPSLAIKTSGSELLPTCILRT